ACADRRHVLDEASGKLERAERVELRDGIGLAVDVVEGDGGSAQPVQQRGHGAGRQRMRQRLEEGIAASAVGEGFDPQHGSSLDLASRGRDCYWARASTD